jgi:hypothetical protein
MTPYSLHRVQTNHSLFSVLFFFQKKKLITFMPSIFFLAGMLWVSAPPVGWFQKKETIVV